MDDDLEVIMASMSSDALLDAAREHSDQHEQDMAVAYLSRFLDIGGEMDLLDLVAEGTPLFRHAALSAAWSSGRVELTTDLAVEHVQAGGS